jgi:hypothetical protein
MLGDDNERVFRRNGGRELKRTKLGEKMKKSIKKEEKTCNCIYILYETTREKHKWKEGDKRNKLNNRAKKNEKGNT